MDIALRPLVTGPEAWDVEVVEHKGVGHPAHRIAASLIHGIPEIAEAHCLLLGATDSGQSIDPLRSRIEAVVRAELESMGGLVGSMLRGEVRLF